MDHKRKSRADEISEVLNKVKDLIIPFIHNADFDESIKHNGQGLSLSGTSGTSIVESHPPRKLQRLLNPRLPTKAEGVTGLLRAVQTTLDYSVNTFDRGFLDKLYASTDAPGLAAELVLAALNTNVHVYSVSPALTVIEKELTRKLATLFGLTEENSGGISVQGGAASNMTSMLIARNTMFPITKSLGTAALPKPLILFTSSESHYSISTAATSLGLGTSSVLTVPVDFKGVMDTTALESMTQDAIQSGRQPFYVCATAGTTVRGAYDPLPAIAEICQKYSMHLHVDAAWGGPAIFSSTHKHKLAGSQHADTIAFNPHKMMGVPLTCSFLLGKDLRKFYAANALSAGYLFHEDADDVASAPELAPERDPPPAAEVFDLASFTPQCGRRGDSLKLYLSWIYHGSDGYEQQIDAAFAAAAYMAECVAQRKDMKLVSENPPPCCQVCFYYKPKTVGDDIDGLKKENSRVTRGIVAGLVGKGWMIDYAPGEEGEFMRAVTNRGTSKGVVDGLLLAIGDVGKEVTGMSG